MTTVSIPETRAKLSGGLLSDHTPIRWQVDDVTIDVSVDGHSEPEKQLVIAVAEALEMAPAS